MTSYPYSLECSLETVPKWFLSGFLNNESQYAILAKLLGTHLDDFAPQSDSCFKEIDSPSMKGHDLSMIMYINEANYAKFKAAIVRV